MNAITPKPTGKEVFERRQIVSEELQKSARLLRFTSLKRRNIHRIVGFRPKVRDYFFQCLIAFSFIFCLLIPTSSSVVYFGFIASDQYESEARFVVRSAKSVVAEDKADVSGGGPSDKIVQDTQVIEDFFTSSTMVEELKQRISIDKIYSKNSVDFLSRLTSKFTKEDLQDYWEGKISSSIHASSGIVTVEVVAFDPNDAKLILNNVIEISEERINALNDGLWAGLKSAAQAEFEAARTALEGSRIAYRMAQINSGIYNVDQRAEELEKVVQELEADILQAQSEKDVLSKQLTSDSTRMRLLDRKIEVKKLQQRRLKDTLASSEVSVETLPNFQKEFEQIELEKKIAEKRFANAAVDLERVQIMSTIKLVYIDPFLPPTLPEKPVYPKRILAIILTLLGGILAFGLTSFIVYTVRYQVD